MANAAGTTRSEGSRRQLVWLASVLALALTGVGLAGCSGLVSGNNTTNTPTPTGDTTAPTVSITSPAAGATLSGTVNLTANATDNVAVANVQFRVDGANVGPSLTATPYSYSLNTASLTNASHSISAVATDTSGNSATSAAVTVQVNNATTDTTPPTVSITAPANGATVSGTVSVTATASDNVGVASVQFQLDGANVGSLDTTAPYSFSWNTTGTPNGAHSLRAIAKDAAGNSTTSASVSVTVSNTSTDTTPPSVPTGLAATAASSSQINLVWTASTDNVRVAGYKIFRGGSQVGTATTTSFSDVGLTASTSYTYNVAAYDAAGNNSAQSAGASATTLAASSGGSLPTSLGWFQIPNTTYAPLCPSGQSGNCQYVVDAWSSGVADTKRNRLVFFGGGHNNYSGNEVYALDLNSLQMLRITNADPPNANCTDADASGNPNSRHTYGGISYVPSTDQVYMHAGALWPCGSAGDVSTWLLTLSNLTWAKKDPLNGTQTTANCCNYISFSDYDPVSKAVWYTDSYDLWKYSAQTNTQTHLSAVGFMGYHQNCVVDSDARIFTCFGDTTVQQANMSAATPTMNDITSQTSGCATLAGTDYPGLAYDPVQKKVVAWIGGSSVIVFDSAAKTCTTQNFSGGPGAQSPTGTFNRWRYFPTLGVFALVNNWQQNAWVLRMTAASGTGGSSAPVISGIGVSSITTTSAVVSWTTDVAATSQVEYGTTTAYGSLTTLNSSLVTGHSQTLSSLAVGTVYHYRVHSKNSSGVETISGDAVFSTNSTTDTIPPTVSITSPASGATVSGITTVAASASDNVGVASVQFKVDGANVGSPDTATPYQFSWDTTTATNGVHTVSASATDAAGNVGNAVSVSVTVSNATSGTTQDFQTRCSQAGVIACVGFDSATDFVSSLLSPGSDGVLRGALDTTVFASGGGSLKFTVPSFGDSNISGYWQNQWSQSFGAGTTFYVQYRQRFSPEFLSNKWPATGGGTTFWKQQIFSHYGATCAALELTTVNYYGTGFPTMYMNCGADSLYVQISSTDWLLEQGDTLTSGYNCKYSNINATDCFMYPANTWVVFYYKVHIGNYGQANSSIQAWVAANGQPYKEWINIQNHVINQDQVGNDFNAVLLAPYMTSRDSTISAGPTAYTWYDELIVSSSPIAAPNN